MTAEPCFNPALFSFLRQLARNNDREWFEAHRDRYVRDVRDPALAFINSVAPGLRALSPHLVADPRPSGGSLFRLSRDGRFGGEAGPYKRGLGMGFGLGGRGDRSSPCLYLHLEPRGSWAGGGVREPDGAAMAMLRDAAESRPAAWRAARRARLALMGEDAAGSAGARLRRDSFFWTAHLSDAEVCAPTFMKRYLELCRAAAPIHRFAARALDLDW